MQAQSHTSNSIKPKAHRSHQVKINIFGGERFYSGLPNFCASCAQKFSDDRQLSFDPRHLHSKVCDICRRLFCLYTTLYNP